MCIYLQIHKGLNANIFTHTRVCKHIYKAKMLNSYHEYKLRIFLINPGNQPIHNINKHVDNVCKYIYLINLFACHILSQSLKSFKLIFKSLQTLIIITILCRFPLIASNNAQCLKNMRIEQPVK